MYCKNCGYELSNDTKFCPNCGQKTETGRPDFMAMATEEYNQKSRWTKSFSKKVRQKEIEKIAKRMEQSWLLANTDDEIYTCPKCNSIADKTSTICSECGENIRLAVCKSCGRKFMNRRDDNRDLCRKCHNIIFSG